MIQIVLDASGSRLCPILACEICGNPVDWQNGVLVWVDRAAPKVTHWRGCQRAMEARLMPDGGRCSWDHIKNILTQMLYNTKTPQAAWRTYMVETEAREEIERAS